MDKPITVGVEILLERMKLFPEEFVTKDGSFEGSKWHMYLPTTHQEDREDMELDIDYPEMYLPPEEIAMLRQALRKLYADMYTHRVMEKLATPKRGSKK